MRITWLALLTLVTTVATPTLSATEPGTEADAKMPVIILKLDDITRSGASGGRPIASRWQRCLDFLEKEGVRASFGIIGYSLEEDVPAYFDWIKAVHAKGNIEFWNHGYKARKGQEDSAEFEGVSLEAQTAALQRTQQLASEKLGIELKAFGPHWSGTDKNTEKALEAIPGIQTWFFGPGQPTHYTKTVLERTINLEQPTFVPNPEAVRTRFETIGRNKPYLALQGHPNGWNDERFKAFTEVVMYLKSQGCSFMTVSEYVDATQKDADE